MKNILILLLTMICILSLAGCAKENISKDVDLEETWASKHQDSEDPIDRAILLSLELSKKDDPTPLSALTPQNSEAILSAMRTIPVKYFPEVWRRCCMEVAYRAQKLTAMEQFLNISLNYGLYDPWAQEQWYHSFTEKKNNLPKAEITENDYPAYGNLLLPLMEEKLKGGKLTNGEWTVLQKMIVQINEQFAFSEEAPDSTEQALAWFAAHQDLCKAIQEIIAHDYEWVPRTVE